LQHFSPSDDRILPVLHKAGELGVPVVFDVFPQGPGLIKEILPLNYDWIAKTVPKTKIILAHSGGSRILDALLVAKANSNVYLDLSYSLLYYQGSSVLGDFLFAVKKIGAQRVIYGSDYPEVGIVESFEKVGEILDGLFIHEREWVFGKTISSLLNLE
jgi:predicted TIM-barrel fold metal-dependent hydrolase